MSTPTEKIALENFNSGFPRKILPGTIGEYTAFIPSLIEKSWIWSDPEINVLLEGANIALGNLNSFAKQIPNVDVYIKTHLTTEANKSNRIEGTQTSIEEDLLPEEEVAPEKRDDRQEVHNYINAMNFGVEQALSPEGLPLCNRLLCEIHRILLDGVRGEHKMPGEFRQSQNWIGGSSISEASYIPPPETELPALLQDFERFIYNKEAFVPHLIKCAILHYQFETIHPFLDGNGRIGRLMVPLYLLSNGILSKPCFYISDYFERRRVDYYDSLQRARTKNDLIDWVKFFLRGVETTAKSAYRKFENVVSLVKQYERKIMGFGVKNAANYQKALETFYAAPIRDAKDVKEATGLAQSSVNRILKRFEEEKIISEITGYGRNKIYIMRDYLNKFSEE